MMVIMSIIGIIMLLITVLSISVIKRHLRWDQRESHQAKQSKNKTQGVFSHAAFDFDAPGH